MNDPLEDRVRAHYGVLGSQPMPEALEDRLLEHRRRQAATPRWVGVVVGIATAAVVFAAIAVPLLARTNRGPSPGTGGTSLGAIRADFVELVNTDLRTLGKNVTTAQSACAGAVTPAQQTRSCTTMINALSGELLEINAAFNTATVPGGVAAQMAQLVQADGAFAIAYPNGSTAATVVLTDATTVESDLRILQQALATS
jgi:hypothetical protein